MKVAFQGLPGAYSEAALAAHFSADVTSCAVPAFQDVFDQVAQGLCAYGVIPIENSLAGSVLENYDLLLEFGVVIVGEVNLPIRHCLLAPPGTDLVDVRIAKSHPQALAQCAEFLRQHKIIGVAESNTATAARNLAQSQAAGEAVIASERAAGIHGLDVVVRGIQERVDNTTRFFVISAIDREASETNKATLAFGTRNIPGALLRCLAVFEQHGLNMTKLESRPTGGALWEYLFHADIERADQGHLSQAQLKGVEADLVPHVQMIKILGLYPRAIAQ